MSKLVWALLTILATSYVANAYKILVIFPLPGKSHTILGNAVVKHLLNAGHEVTFITSIVNKKTHPKLHQVDVSSHWKLVPEELFNIKNVMDGQNNPSDRLMQLFIFYYFATETVKHENVQNLLKDENHHFDLIFVEWMYNELYSGLSAIYGAPLIWFSTIDPHGQVLSLIDEYLNTAYNGYFTDNLPPFSFGVRVSELWNTVKIAAVKESVIRVLNYWQYNKLIVPHIEARGRIPPSFETLRYNASLVVGNTHVSMGQATRLPQSYKAIGGFHVQEQTEPLPDDLKNLMESSEHGVIYFSMGSNLKSKDLPDELKRDFLNVFGSLKQTVLWKFEEELPNVPKNVHILKWAPQQSILAHPKCVLFITHGGLLSTIEAIHAGMPIIGIPVFADQFTNVDRAAKKGFAKKVQLSYTMANELKTTIEEILTDPKYRQKVKELSVIYHDRPAKPAVELVHWVEHVIKTKGAPHLRSAALDVPWYQKAYLDLVLVLAVLIYVLRKVLKIVLPMVFPKRFGPKQKTN